ncbi:hypothetical protein IEQ34_010018 [Dendrobium chrysotoxum]|uniref:Uncharacterized protein n=1 Tax=Dendrobium chrysotoxum TaxID=161865 RepID=A0AAV7H4J9_DENCH|nr:hypothetical protein IEQ34_010018 [Dendrobium chrysotoxum]
MASIAISAEALTTLERTKASSMRVPSLLISTNKLRPSKPFPLRTKPDIRAVQTKTDLSGILQKSSNASAIHPLAAYPETMAVKETKLFNSMESKTQRASFGSPHLEYMSTSEDLTISSEEKVETRT